MGKVTVTYRAPKGDEKVVETRGLTFFDGQPQELDESEHSGFISKARNNPHFEVAEGAAPKPKDDDADADPWSKMPIAQLREEAEKRGIAHEDLGKAQLRDAIKAYDEAN